MSVRDVTYICEVYRVDLSTLSLNNTSFTGAPVVFRSPAKAILLVNVYIGFQREMPSGSRCVLRCQ